MWGLVLTERSRGGNPLQLEQVVATVTGAEEVARPFPCLRARLRRLGVHDDGAFSDNAHLEQPARLTSARRNGTIKQGVAEGRHAHEDVGKDVGTAARA